MSSIRYFAYGSNMLSERLRGRCPSAISRGMATLAGYELRWHKRSRKDDTGKCDIVRSEAPGAMVYGVLFDLDSTDLAKLDRAEGCGQGYERKELSVLSYGGSCLALTYVATEIDATRQPTAEYRGFVVAGAREHGLPEAYVQQLAAVVAVDDVDEAR